MTLGFAVCFIYFVWFCIIIGNRAIGQSGINLGMRDHDFGFEMVISENILGMFMSK